MKKIANLSLLLAVASALWFAPGSSYGAKLPWKSQREENPCPKARASLRAVKLKTPTRAEYLNLVAEISKKYKEKLDKQDLALRFKLDNVLFTATRVAYGSDLGSMMLATNQGSAGIYLISWSAKKDPDDFLTANNLGVALKGTRDYESALLVLLYAHKLQPESPLVMDNAAWVYLKLGDGASGKKLFEKSLKLNPDDEEALAGLGLLCQCRGDYNGAVEYARRSLKQKFLPIAAAVLDSAEDGMEEQSSQTKSDGKAGQGSAAGNEQPIENPRGRETRGGIQLSDPPFSGNVAAVAAGADQIQKYELDGDREAKEVGKEINSVGRKIARKPGHSRKGNTITYPRTYDKELFILGDIARIYNRQIAKATDAFQKEHQKLEKDFAQARFASVAGMGEGMMTKETEILMPREAELKKHQESQEKMDEVAEEMRRCTEKAGKRANAAEGKCGPINDPSNPGYNDCMAAAEKQLDNEVKRCQEPFDWQFAQFSKDTEKQAHETERKTAKMKSDCEEKKKLAERLHPQFYTAWNNYWTKVRKELHDYYGDAQPWIDDIHNSDLNELENLMRKQFVLTHDVEQRQAVANWAIEMKGLYPAEECAPKAPPPPPSKKGVLKVWPPEECHLPTFYIWAGPLDYQATCEGLKIEFSFGKIGEGIKVGPSVGAEWKFGKANDWSEDTLVISVGVKAEAGKGTFKIGGQVGGDIVINPVKGEVVDVGLKTEESAGFHVGPEKVGLEGEAKTEDRIGLESPNSVESESGAKIGPAWEEEGEH